MNNIEDINKKNEDKNTNKSDYDNLVNDIVSKIKELKTNEETTIAKLINYDPLDDTEPLEQGKILDLVKKECQKESIILERVREGFTGLPYYFKFIKKS